MLNLIHTLCHSFAIIFTMNFEAKNRSFRRKERKIKEVKVFLASACTKTDINVQIHSQGFI